MATQGTSSTSRRSVSEFREEKSGSSLVPSALHAGDGNVAVTPRCFCGVYAIMYMSKTVSNLNRIFLGCPFYKHLPRIGSNCCICDRKHVEDVEGEEELDHRMAVLEEKIVVLKKKKNPLAWCITNAQSHTVFHFFGTMKGGLGMNLNMPVVVVLVGANVSWVAAAFGPGMT
ncbi:hypothetical protein Ahy_A04g018048 [Arachis hypogaea]|uniref:Uncharacterized protein n=1 Tax=Arachis hypogaea TaxID=3818 RepID=A0A445DCQ3_ARAHY|nr:hypothetical protein Ahy_A04g018048 [Arachis hypogaea]